MSLVDSQPIKAIKKTQQLILEDPGRFVRKMAAIVGVNGMTMRRIFKKKLQTIPT